MVHFSFSQICFHLIFFPAKWQVEFQGQNTVDGNTFYPDIGPPQEKKLTLMMRNGLLQRKLTSGRELVANMIRTIDVDAINMEGKLSKKNKK